MSGLPGTQTVRTLRIRSKVRAVVEATVTVSDDEVREWLRLAPDDEVDWESVQEFALEETDESMYDLHDITGWDSNDVELMKTERKHVEPPEFVALPGMEGL